MGRGAAKRALESRQGAIDAEMKQVRRTFGKDGDGVEIRGIVGNTPKTPLDECGHVYKDLDEVLRVLEVEGIAEVRHRLYPVANLKGTD
jgi:RNA-splicing ligase RtcB